MKDLMRPKCILLRIINNWLLKLIPVLHALELCQEAEAGVSAHITAVFLMKVSKMKDY